MKSLRIRSLAALALLSLTALLPVPRGHGEDAAPVGLSLRIELGGNQVYQGEKVAVVVILRSDGATLRNIGYPRLAAPPVEFAPVSPVADQAAADGKLYRFAGELSTDVPGAIRIGPARLDCEMAKPSSGSEAFFGKVEFRKTTVVSQPATLRVVPLPADRPPAFSGAVGAFAMQVVTNPAAIPSDEPVTITTVIQGDGNLSRARCPGLSGPGLRGYPVKENREAGKLVCEQVVVPLTEEPLPKIEWAYFNPENGRYQTLRAALPAPRKSATKPAVPPAAAPSPRPEGPGYRLLWGVAGLTVVGALGLWARARQRKAVRSDEAENTGSSDSGALDLSPLAQALADGDVEKFYTEVFVALQAMIGKASRRNPVSIASASVCYGFVTDWKDKEILEISELFETCVEIRYGRRIPARTRMKEDYERLARLVMSDFL